MFTSISSSSRSSRPVLYFDVSPTVRCWSVAGLCALQFGAAAALEVEAVHYQRQADTPAVASHAGKHGSAELVTTSTHTGGAGGDVLVGDIFRVTGW